MPPLLSPDEQRTYDQVFQHPISHNLDGRHVRSLFEALGDVTEEHNGHLKIARNGHFLSLHPAHSNHSLEADEVMRIRHFLEESAHADPHTKAERTHLVVVIEHRQALIYRSDLAGTLPERIVPYDPESNGRHVHRIEDHHGNVHEPAAPSFYAAIAESLRGADEIIIFSTRTGGKNLMDNLLAELERNHPETSKRIVGALLAEEKHLSEEQVMAKVRDFYHKNLSGVRSTAPNPE